MISEKFCPVCHHLNEDTALICGTCGAVLDGIPTNVVTVTEPTSPVEVEDKSAFIHMDLIPKGGVGILVAGALMPYYLTMDKELIIGREAGVPLLENVLDLTVLNAFDLGVSRRHAMIRRIDSEFEVFDLGSRNGTWLNARQLLPNQPYRFASGSHLRLGRMQLFIMYHTPEK